LDDTVDRIFDVRVGGLAVLVLVLVNLLEEQVAWVKVVFLLDGR